MGLQGKPWASNIAYSVHLAVVRLLAARPDLDRNARSTRRTSYFLAAKHGFEEVCAFLEALARADDESAEGGEPTPTPEPAGLSR